MADPITNPSPKARFLESANNVSAHRDLVDSPAFQRAADFALLQYQSVLSMQNRDMNQAASNALKMQGAHEFLQEFRMLSEKPAPMPLRTLPSQLDHSAQ